ncbi:hypothetical protein SAMN05444280_11839 [Tangfeifania diversioriginum]|uniref:Uncharacterized protein n=1 Tax=Tangfeifania diversioriginum TaxID=1168035 RepID=A0A1M6IYD1_9BACT|nr:hypothetical protein SAMN05444280_11839 [Tangfeifania diversioriginum]
MKTEYLDGFEKELAKTRDKKLNIKCSPFIKHQPVPAKHFSW